MPSTFMQASDPAMATNALSGEASGGRRGEREGSRSSPIASLAPSSRRF
jgi:hypothetical protein